ncbi:MAG: redoxin domain-containing protein [Anaerolineae bacterium]|nr:redoxin domain-containing protein [Anaerolineae bacterium]
MPKWISVEVRDSSEAKDTKGSGAPPPPPSDGSSSSGNAGAWIASIIVTLLILLVAGGVWYFGIRPSQSRPATVGAIAPAAPAPGGASGAALPNAAAALPSAPGSPAPLDDLPAVVATVNGEAITREQLTNLIRINQALYPVMNGSDVTLDAASLQNLRASLLDQMVSNRLEQAAARKEGISVTDADIEAEFATFKNTYRVDDGRLEAALARFNLTTADFKTWLRDSALVNRFWAQKGQQSAQAGQPVNRQSWINDQLVTADVQVLMPGAANNAPLKIGEAPPNFSLKDLDGKTWTLSELKGKPVVVNFWATWCAPCKFEMPHFQTAYQKYKDQGLVILAVDIKTDNGEPAVRKFVQDLGITFPTPFDTTGDIEAAYRVKAYPTTYFVGRDGKLKEVKRGAIISEDQLKASLDKILAQ